MHGRGLQSAGLRNINNSRFYLEQSKIGITYPRPRWRPQPSTPLCQWPPNRLHSFCLFVFVVVVVVVVVCFFVVVVVFFFAMPTSVSKATE